MRPCSRAARSARDALRFIVRRQSSTTAARSPASASAGGGSDGLGGSIETARRTPHRSPTSSAISRAALRFSAASLSAASVIWCCAICASQPIKLASSSTSKRS
jgi:hypothetical protein